MRCSLFIGLDTAVSVKGFFEVRGCDYRPCTSGGFEIRHGDTEFIIFNLGMKKIYTKTYRIFSVLMYKGNIKKLYRWLQKQMIPTYTLQNAPLSLRNLIIKINEVRDMDGNVVKVGELKSPHILAGENRNLIDRVVYKEGASEDGQDDQLVEEK
jgi:hypothetical protein